jgi:tRNA modification GTPase
VADRSRRPGRGEIDHILALAGEYAIIVVLNKSDLPSAWGAAQCARVGNAVPVVTLSALTGEGLAALEEGLHMAITSGDMHMEDDVIIVRVRQRELLERAVAALGRAEEQLRGEGLPELLCADVDAALKACGELTGTVTSEDILDRIFAEFCIGK